jgi:hypothetical protein
VRSVFFAEAEFDIVFHVDGVGADAVGAVGANLEGDALLDGSGEDEGAVVVGVFTDEVDAPGGGVDRAYLLVEMFAKSASYKFDIDGC